MPSWKKDLDALVKQTMAFARAVTPAAPSYKELAPPTVNPVQNQAETTVSQDLPSQSASDEAPVGKAASNEREEIGRRLASFKAHQERWTRDREEYANSMLDRIRLPRDD
jgi:hypothetical protein